MDLHELTRSFHDDYFIQADRVGTSIVVTIDTTEAGEKYFYKETGEKYAYFHYDWACENEEEHEVKITFKHVSKVKEFDFNWMKLCIYALVIKDNHVWFQLVENEDVTHDLEFDAKEFELEYIY